MTTTTSATNDKYDRQLRLWGASGQRALGETCAVLLRATAAGTETLKNLVLPGIGSFCILDDVNDTKEEYSSNFFLTAEPKQPRAQRACELLQELNPDVKGSFRHVPEGLVSLFSNKDWKQQNVLPPAARYIVIASDLEPSLLDLVANRFFQDGSSHPLVAVHSYGLTGVVRLQVPGLIPLLQPKLRDTVPDLRLAPQPFSKLQHLYEHEWKLHDMETWNQMTNAQHGHVPYPMILLHVAQEWKSSHNQSLPQTWPEKQEFAQQIRKMARNYDNELNFQQAHANAYLAYTPRSTNSDYWDELREQQQPESKLGILLQALQKFMTSNGQPPLAGTIPDMDASTELYVRLQQVYQAQASDDWQAMRALVPATTVSDEDLTNFCHNVYHVNVLHTGPLSVLPPSTTVKDEIKEDLLMAAMEGESEERPEHTPLLWWVGFLACQQFAADYHRYPGTVESSYKDDTQAVHQCLIQIAKSYGLAETTLVQQHGSDVALEFTRYANAELHTIASVVGGVASQEVVKILTGQYIPLDNTYVYNGVASTAGVYKV